MPKWIVRIVALLLVPCLAGDASSTLPALARPDVWRALFPAGAATFKDWKAALVADPALASAYASYPQMSPDIRPLSRAKEATDPAVFESQALILPLCAMLLVGAAGKPFLHTYRALSGYTQALGSTKRRGGPRGITRRKKQPGRLTHQRSRRSSGHHAIAQRPGTSLTRPVYRMGVQIQRVIFPIVKVFALDDQGGWLERTFVFQYSNLHEFRKTKHPMPHYLNVEDDRIKETIRYLAEAIAPGLINTANGFSLGDLIRSTTPLGSGTIEIFFSVSMVDEEWVIQHESQQHIEGRLGEVLLRAFHDLHPSQNTPQPESGTVWFEASPAPAAAPDSAASHRPARGGSSFGKPRDERHYPYGIDGPNSRWWNRFPLSPSPVPSLSRSGRHGMPGVPALSRGNNDAQNGPRRSPSGARDAASRATSSFLVRNDHLFYATDYDPPALRADVRLIRHGETLGQKRKIFQGNRDKAQNQLGEEGHRQKVSAAALLFRDFEDVLRTSPEDIVIIESPLGRAVDTRKAFTDLVAKRLKRSLTVETLDLAREIDFGRWDGLSEEEILKKWGLDELERAKRYRYEVDPTVVSEGGTSYLDFLTHQASDLLTYINEKHAGKTVLLFAHGTLGSALSVLLSYPEVVTKEGHIDWRAMNIPNAVPFQLQRYSRPAADSATPTAGQPASPERFGRLTASELALSEVEGSRRAAAPDTADTETTETPTRGRGETPIEVSPRHPVAASARPTSDPAAASTDPDSIGSTDANKDHRHHPPIGNNPHDVPAAQFPVRPAWVYEPSVPQEMRSELEDMLLKGPHLRSVLERAADKTRHPVTIAFQAYMNIAARMGYTPEMGYSIMFSQEWLDDNEPNALGALEHEVAHIGVYVDGIANLEDDRTFQTSMRTRPRNDFSHSVLQALSDFIAVCYQLELNWVSAASYILDVVVALNQKSHARWVNMAPGEQTRQAAFQYALHYLRSFMAFDHENRGVDPATRETFTLAFKDILTTEEMTVIREALNESLRGIPLTHLTHADFFDALCNKLYTLVGSLAKHSRAAAPGTADTETRGPPATEALAGPPRSSGGGDTGNQGASDGPSAFDVSPRPPLPASPRPTPKPAAAPPTVEPANGRAGDLAKDPPNGSPTHPVAKSLTRPSDPASGSTSLTTGPERAGASRRAPALESADVRNGSEELDILSPTIDALVNQLWKSISLNDAVGRSQARRELEALGFSVQIGFSREMHPYSDPQHIEALTIYQTLTKMATPEQLRSIRDVLSHGMQNIAKWGGGRGFLLMRLNTEARAFQIVMGDSGLGITYGEGPLKGSHAPIHEAVKLGQSFAAGSDGGKGLAYMVIDLDDVSVTSITPEDGVARGHWWRKGWQRERRLKSNQNLPSQGLKIVGQKLLGPAAAPATTPLAGKPGAADTGIDSPRPRVPPTPRHDLSASPRHHVAASDSVTEPAAAPERLPSQLKGKWAWLSNAWGEAFHWLLAPAFGFQDARMVWQKDQAPYVHVPGLPARGVRAFLMAAVHPLINLFWTLFPWLIWDQLAGLPQGPPAQILITALILHAVLNAYGFLGNLISSYVSLVPLTFYEYDRASDHRLIARPRFSISVPRWEVKANSDWNRMVYTLSLGRLGRKPEGDDLHSELPRGATPEDRAASPRRRVPASARPPSYPASTPLSFKQKQAFILAHEDRLGDLKNPRHKRVLRRYFLEGKTQEVLAAELGQGQSSVSSLIARAFRALLDWVYPDEASDLKFVRDHEDRLRELNNPRYESILRGYFLEGKTHEVLAAELGISVRSVSDSKRTAIRVFRDKVNPDEASDRKFVIDHEGLLGQLAPSQVRALTGYFLEGKTLPELAHAYGITKQAVAEAKDLGLRQLRRWVKTHESLLQALVEMDGLVTVTRISRQVGVTALRVNSHGGVTGLVAEAAPLRALARLEAGPLFTTRPKRDLSLRDKGMTRHRQATGLPPPAKEQTKGNSFQESVNARFKSGTKSELTEFLGSLTSDQRNRLTDVQRRLLLFVWLFIDDPMGGDHYGKIGEKLIDFPMQTWILGDQSERQSDPWIAMTGVAKTLQSFIYELSFHWQRGIPWRRKTMIDALQGPTTDLLGADTYQRLAVLARERRYPKKGNRSTRLAGIDSDDRIVDSIGGMDWARGEWFSKYIDTPYYDAYAGLILAPTAASNDPTKINPAQTPLARALWLKIAGKSATNTRAESWFTAVLEWLPWLALVGAAALQALHSPSGYSWLLIPVSASIAMIFLYALHAWVPRWAPPGVERVKVGRETWPLAAGLFAVDVLAGFSVAWGVGLAAVPLVLLGWFLHARHDRRIFNQRTTGDRDFGKTGLRFFVLGLGTIWLGRRWPPGNASYSDPSEEEIDKHLEEAFVSMGNKDGVVMLDTAAAYGRSEERLGRFLLKRPDLARRAFIATKWGEEFDPVTNRSWKDFSVQNLRASFKRSQDHLGKVDLLYIHMSTDASADVLRDEAVRQEMERMKIDGEVRLIGASISNEAILAEAIEQGSLNGFDVIQMPAPLFLKRPALASALHQRGFAVVLNSPVRKADNQNPENAIRELANRPEVSMILTGTRMHLGETVSYLGTPPSAPKGRLPLWRQWKNWLFAPADKNARFSHRVRAAA